MDISESWAINKFEEETGIKEGYIIDSLNRYAGQAIIFITITKETKFELERKFKFVSEREFLKHYNTDTISYVPFSKSLFNLDPSSINSSSINSEHIYYLKTYTNSIGKIATSYYVIILSIKENKVIFTEAFNDL